MARSRSSNNSKDSTANLGFEDDGYPFEVKMPRLVVQLEAQFVESARLEN